MTVLRTALVVALLAVAAHAQPAITASDASVTVSAAGGTAAAYLTISNPTMYDIYVTSVTSDAAGQIEMRQADQLIKVLTVPSFGFLELKAGGPHLMLMDLKRALKAGETIEIVLTTDAGIVIKAPAPVKAS